MMLFKKIKIVALAVVLFISMSVPLFAADPQPDTQPRLMVSITNGIVYAGGDVSVTVSLENAVGISGIEFNMTYNESRIRLYGTHAQNMARITIGRAFSEMSYTSSSVTSAHYFNIETDGVIRFVAVCNPSNIAKGYNGTLELFTVRFTGADAQFIDAPTTPRDFVRTDSFNITDIKLGNTKMQSVSTASPQFYLKTTPSIYAAGSTSPIPGDSRDVKVSFYTAGTENLVNSTTVKYGQPFEVAISPGTYDIVYESTSFLTMRQTNVEISSTSTLPPQPMTPGDVNADSVIDIRDIVAVIRGYDPLAHITKSNTPLTCDVNGDGKVDMTDIEWILSSYNQQGN